jgi:hypothetical protein
VNDPVSQPHDCWGALDAPEGLRVLGAQPRKRFADDFEFSLHCGTEDVAGIVLFKRLAGRELLDRMTS